MRTWLRDGAGTSDRDRECGTKGTVAWRCGPPCVGEGLVVKVAAVTAAAVAAVAAAADSWWKNGSRRWAGHCCCCCEMALCHEVRAENSQLWSGPQWNCGRSGPLEEAWDGDLLWRETVVRLREVGHSSGREKVRVPVVGDSLGRPVRIIFQFGATVCTKSWCVHPGRMSWCALRGGLWCGTRLDTVQSHTRNAWSLGGVAQDGVVVACRFQARVTPGEGARRTRGPRAHHDPTRSPFWRPNVLPRVRWRFVHVQARELRFVWPRQAAGMGALGHQGVSLGLRGPGDGVAKGPSILRDVDKTDRETRGSGGVE